MRQTGLTERPALLLVFSLPQNKADLPLVTSKSAEMITRALRSITVSTCHQKVSEKADRRHKSDQGSNNSKPDVKGNDAEVSNSSALPPPSPGCESLHPQPAAAARACAKVQISSLQSELSEERQKGVGKVAR